MYTNVGCLLFVINAGIKWLIDEIRDQNSFVFNIFNV